MNDKNYHSQFFAHDWYFGWLNMNKIATGDASMICYSRPMFPIIKSNPSTADIFANLNKSDLGGIMAHLMVATYCSLKSLSSMDLNSGLTRYTAKEAQIATPYTFNFAQSVLQVKTHKVRKIFVFMFASAALSSYLASHRRLTGNMYNGKRWSRKIHSIHKYDMLRNSKKLTFWSRFMFIQ